MSPAAAKTSTAKGEETRAQILAAAVQQASAAGFESITIGSLAERTGMSKSGLFAHFGSRLDLQIAALDEASRLFTEQVFQPALRAPRGLKRLQSLFDHWLGWSRRVSLPGGCPIGAAVREYEQRTGPMRDAVLERNRNLARELGKTISMAIESGELAPDTEPGEIAFGLFAIILAHEYTEALLGSEHAERRARVAFERLLQPHRRG